VRLLHLLPVDNKEWKRNPLRGLRLILGRRSGLLGVIFDGFFLNRCFLDGLFFDGLLFDRLFLDRLLLDRFLFDGFLFNGLLLDRSLFNGGLLRLFNAGILLLLGGLFNGGFLDGSFLRGVTVLLGPTEDGIGSLRANKLALV